MKYFIQNPDLDNQIKDIRKKIQLSMNGVVSDAMKDYGFNYKQNFGVQIPRLKQLAQNYIPNHDLAQRLWVLKIRETMILATFLQPAEMFSEKDANEWIENIDNIELAEQTTMNLFSKLTYAKNLSLKLISSNNDWKQIIGFILITRIKDFFDFQEIEEISNRGIKLLDTENYNLYKSISVCLARFCRNGVEVAVLIRSKISELNNLEKGAYKFAKNEIETELSFMDF